MKLNQLLTKLGIASRRKVNALIQAKKVTINDEVIQNFTLEIKKTDVIKINWDNVLNFEDYRKRPTSIKSKEIANVYLALNKPLGYITSFRDPHHDKTVYDLLPKKYRKTLHSMGRLDKDTTGILLFSNDGELTQKLTHPKKEIVKKYQVSLNKAMLESDFKKMKAGLPLSDGFIKADSLAYSTKKTIVMTIHSGRNKIIRRMFAHLNYRVLKLTRVAFASITTASLGAKKWRFLNEQEIKKLKEL